jgi:cell division protein FtsN
MKDYAKKNYTQRNKKTKSRFFILISAIFIVALILIYFFHPFQKNHSKKLTAEHKPQKVQSTKIKIPAKEIKKTTTVVSNTNTTNQSTTADFDFSFYKMLPKMSVTTPKVQTATQKTATIHPKQYFLQVASSKDKNGADILIKQLDEYGFPTSMTTTLRRHTRWYHIFLGPYTYLSDAKKDQYRLYRDFHMNGILRVVDNDKTA